MQESFSRNQFPSGGWQFYQPQTGWSPPTPISSTFDQTVVLIIKHRLQNPAVTAQHKLATDAINVGNELETFNRQRLGIASPPGGLPKSEPRPEAPNRFAAVAAEARAVAQGAKSPLEWLASGLPPVSSEKAKDRASVCLGCQKNNIEGGFTKWFTVPAAEAIQTAIELRKDLNLQTPYDEALGICMACYCPLKLKVHEPIEIIAKHTKPEIRAKLWDQCWILSESETTPPDNSGGY